MSALEPSHRTVGRAFAAMLLSFLLGTSVAQPAPADGVPAGKMNPVVAAPRPAASVPVSPHARAARQRAAVQAEAAASGIRVSPFTATRKPHNLASHR